MSHGQGWVMLPLTDWLEKQGLLVPWHGLGASSGNHHGQPSMMSVAISAQL